MIIMELINIKGYKGKLVRSTEVKLLNKNLSNRINSELDQQHGNDLVNVVHKINTIFNLSLIHILLDRAVSQDLLQAEESPPEELNRLRQASRNKKARGLRNIKQAAEEQKLTPFIDMSQPPYQAIMEESSGKEGF